MKKKLVFTFCSFFLIITFFMFFYNIKEENCKWFIVKKCAYYITFDNFREGFDHHLYLEEDSKEILEKYNAEVIFYNKTVSEVFVYMSENNAKKIEKEVNVKEVKKKKGSGVRMTYP